MGIANSTSDEPGFSHTRTSSTLFTLTSAGACNTSVAHVQIEPEILVEYTVNCILHSIQVY